MRYGKVAGHGHGLPLRLVLCLFLLANPLLGIAAGDHGALPDQAAAAAPPCHGGSAAAASTTDRATADCPHCAGHGPAAACQCCDLGATSVPPEVPATPIRHETSPVTLAARLSHAFPPSPGERRYRPPIDAA